MQERSQAKAEAAKLSAKVAGLETEQRMAAARMQEAGAMWSQASGLAQRTVEELSAAAERIAWLEEELAASREIAASSSAAAERSRCSDGNGSFQGTRRGTFTYGSVGSQMAALRHVHERLSASEAMDDPHEASALLRSVTSELASLVQSVAVSSSAIPVHPVRRGRNASRSSEPPTTPPSRRSSDFASAPRRYRFSEGSPDAARPRAAAAPHAKQPTASNHHLRSTATAGAAGPHKRLPTRGRLLPAEGSRVWQTPATAKLRPGGASEPLHSCSMLYTLARQLARSPEIHSDRFYLCVDNKYIIPYCHNWAPVVLSIPVTY